MSSPHRRPRRARSDPTGATWRQHYNLSTGIIWGFNYAPFNFSTNDPKVDAVNQLYIRQALQTAIDQNGVIKNVYKGYGFPSYTALPAGDAGQVDSRNASPTRIPFNLTTAKALLTSHGWTIGTASDRAPTRAPARTSAARASPRATRLSFTFVYGQRLAGR